MMYKGKLLPAPTRPCLLHQHFPSLRASSASSHSLLPSFSCWKLTPIPSVSWRLPSLLFPRLPWIPSPLPVHVCPTLWAHCGLPTPLPCPLGCWQEAIPSSLHPVPFGNTLYTWGLFLLAAGVQLSKREISLGQKEAGREVGK